LLPLGLVPPVPFAANPMAIKTQNFVRIHIVMRLHLRILSKTLSVDENKAIALTAQAMHYRDYQLVI
jgi:hypothetical protein